MLNFIGIPLTAVCVNILAESAVLLWFYYYYDFYYLLWFVIIEEFQENQMKLNFMQLNLCNDFDTCSKKKIQCDPSVHATN